MLKQVEAMGSLSVPWIAWRVKGGLRYLNPRSGGLEQLVTNFNSNLICSLLNVFKSFQNYFTTVLVGE
jgi:hypothetical protein